MLEAEQSEDMRKSFEGNALVTSEVLLFDWSEGEQTFHLINNHTCLF